VASTVGIVVSGIAETDTEPPVTLRLCVVGEEETGCDARLIEADRANVDGCIIGETTGEPGRHSMRVADRGSVLLTLVAEGEAAHGSRPMFGANATDRLSTGIATLRAEIGALPLEVSPAVVPIVEESVAPHRHSAT
jgi:succinyl-diaminopimelate desuccinylase